MERTHVAISSLVDRIGRAEIKLPEIQRGYVWKPAQIAHLLDSLYRGYPSGSMLLWRPEEDVAERVTQITQGQAGPLAPRQYLLDGQQRLTSLHRVFTDHPDAEIVFNVEEQRFQVQSAATAKDGHWIRVVDVLTAEKLSPMRRAMCTQFPSLDEDLVEERLSRVKRIAAYEYYIEVLTELPYKQVAEIFVRVNSKGRTLRTVDLALATLSAEWPGIVAKIDAVADEWAGKGWPRIDATFLVRCLAASGTDNGTVAQLARTSIPQLEGGWEATKRGVASLVHILRTAARIETSNLMPSMNALVPLVALLGRHGAQEMDDPDALIYWLLAAFITGRYNQSADTRIAQDAMAVRSAEPVRALFDVSALGGARLQVIDQMLIGKGAGSPFFLLSFLACRFRDARDWINPPVPISEKGEKTFAIEYHHVHPQATLRSFYSKAEINDLANLAFISSGANKWISDRSPAEYLTLLEERLEEHLVPTGLDLRDAPHYRDFLAARRQLLATAMTDILDKFCPEWVGPGDPTGSDDRPRSVNLTLFEPADGGAAVLRIETRRGDDLWNVSIPSSELERFFQDIESGLTASISIDGEPSTVEPEDDETTIAVGPYLLTGTLSEWRVVLAREQAERVTEGASPPSLPMSAAPPTDREVFAISDSE
jgi:hypothetical protein